MIECLNCEQPFDPIGCRWRCPECGFKASAVVRGPHSAMRDFLLGVGVGIVGSITAMIIDYRYRPRRHWQRGDEKEPEDG
jgi:DNA-directed RNA polymerase subunit RPC12/RpoP